MQSIIKNIHSIQFNSIQPSNTEYKTRVSNLLAYNLKLSLTLRLLKHRLHLRSLHNIALNLKLSTHEQTLSVGLSRDEGGEVGIGELESD